MSRPIQTRKFGHEAPHHTVMLPLRTAWSSSRTRLFRSHCRLSSCSSATTSRVGARLICEISSAFIKDVKWYFRPGRPSKTFPCNRKAINEFHLSLAQRKNEREREEREKNSLATPSKEADNSPQQSARLLPRRLPLLSHGLPSSCR